MFYKNVLHYAVRATRTQDEKCKINYIVNKEFNLEGSYEYRCPGKHLFDNQYPCHKLPREIRYVWCLGLWGKVYPGLGEG